MRIGEWLGRIVGDFERTRSLALGGDPQRPTFLSAMAEGGKWNGGDLSAMDAAQRRALTNSWAFSGIRMIANEISAVPMEVFHNTSVEREPTPVADHPFEIILRRPNPAMGRAFFWQYLTWWLELDGNCFFFVAPDELGNPAELWPLPSNEIRVVPGNKDRFIDHYEYWANGQRFVIPSEFVCQIMFPNPFNIYRGVGPLIAAMLPVDSDLAMSRWNGSFFAADNVMPSAIINLASGDANRPIDPVDAAKLKEELKEDYSAYRRKTMVTNATGTIDVELLAWSQKEMDFLGGRVATREEILIDLGIPPGLLDKSVTEANATVADNTFKEKTIWPTLCLMAEQITGQVIIPFYGSEYEAIFKDIRPVNRKQELEESDRAEKVLTINEMRQRFWGAQPLEDERGSKLVAEIQSVGLGAPEYEPQLPGQINPISSIVPSARSVTDDLRKWRSKAVKSVRTGNGAAVPFRTNAIQAKLVAEIAAGLEQAQTLDDVKSIFKLAEKGMLRSWRPWSGFEDELIGLLMGVLAGEAKKLVKRVQDEGAEAVDDPALWDEQREQMAEAITPTLLALSAAAVERAKDTLTETAMDVDWGLANERAATWARTHSANLVTNVTETTKRKVSEAVGDWIDAGETHAELVKRIQKLTEDGEAVFDRTRAELIATTEATRTYAEANNTAWTAAGYLPAAFKAPAHPNCRCYLQPYKMADGTLVLVWYTARDERVCKRAIDTPWGTVKGCAGLHRTIVSEGAHMGEKVK